MGCSMSGMRPGDLLIQSDSAPTPVSNNQKIYAGWIPQGYKKLVAVTMFNANGMIDRTFGKNGYLTIDAGQIMYVERPQELPDGFGLRVRNNENDVTTLTFSRNGNPTTVALKRSREPLPKQ